MRSHLELRGLLPLLALHALEGDELRDAEDHLRSCAVCQRELAAYHKVTSEFVVQAEAPQHVWDRIEAAIADDDDFAS
jgi:hypothetical protein